MARKPENDALAARTEEIFVARSLLTDEDRPHRDAPIFGVAEIVRFLADRSLSLTPDQTRALFADRTLNASFRALLQRQSRFELPAMAAASAGAVVERTFPGGSVRVAAARFPGHFNVTVTFAEGTASPFPGQLLLILDGEGVSRIEIVEAVGQRTATAVLDTRVEADRLALELLRNPLAEGTFLP